jgi:hypothetical protein
MLVFEDENEISKKARGHAESDDNIAGVSKSLLLLRFTVTQWPHSGYQPDTSCAQRTLYEENGEMIAMRK